MGLFSNSKATEVESLINVIQERLGEYIAIQEKNPHKVHPSVSQMLGNLYDQLFKLYYPNRQSLDNQVITIRANRAPIAIFIMSTFNVGLAFEEDMDCRVFKDETQRTFAKSFKPF